MTIPAINLLPLIGVGAGLLLVAAALGLNQVVRRLRGGVRVPGVVVDVAESPAPSGRSGTIFHPVVRYMTADGELVTTPVALSATLAPPRRGRAVTVVYDPDRPDTVGIASTLWMVRLTGAGFMTAGIAMAAACTAVVLGAGA